MPEDVGPVAVTPSPHGATTIQRIAECVKTLPIEVEQKRWPERPVSAIERT
jgi:hypothetical protein